MKHLILLICFLTGYVFLFAQNDTMGNTSVTITSSYKPMMKSPVKITFSGTQLTSDTFKRISPYDIPSQNLYYRYQSINLSPLALQNDSILLQPDLSNYVKIGYGNYYTHFFNVGYGFKKNATYIVNSYLNYTASKGNVINQDFSSLLFKTTGSYFFTKNELYSKVGVSRNQQYLYGYDHEQYSYDKMEVSHLFRNVSIAVGYRNTQTNTTQLNYNPNVALSLFSNKDSVQENTICVNVPVSKKINNQWSAGLNMAIDLTNYKNINHLLGSTSVKNNLFSIDPSVEYKYSISNIKVGALMAIDNGSFILMPNVKFEYPFIREKLIFHGGLSSTIEKNTYKNLIEINPYLTRLSTQTNTSKKEMYGGVKLNVGKHLAVNFLSGIVIYKNMPLFINDTTDVSKDYLFNLVNELRLHSFVSHLDLSYINKDKLIVTGSITYNDYYHLTNNQHPWNLFPVELKMNIQWMPIKKIKLSSDVFSFSDSKYLQKGGVVQSNKGAVHLNASVDYQINKRVSSFINLNNIFGKNYERWHNYPVYGAGILGGIKCSF